MKKILTIFLSLIAGFLLTGCKNSQEVELMKQQNTLLQQQMDQIQTDKKNAADDINQRQNFENNLKCQERGDVLKTQYRNFYSAYYNELAQTCYVKYYDNNQMLAESPMEDFGPTISPSVGQLQQSIKLYGGVTYQEVINVLNSFQQSNLANLIIKMLLAGNIKDMQIIIGMKEGDDIPIESRADGYFGQYTLNYLKKAATWVSR